MQAPKPFLTHEQQLNRLADDKNLIIADRRYAEGILKQIGYYSLVSGYRELFENPTTKKYKDGTTFEELVALYRFDECLRELFLKNILTIEQKLRSLLSYYFTKHYGESQAYYLSPNSYNNIPKHAKGINDLVDTLGNITINSTGYNYITHQRNKYGNVPLWVLVKALSFGNIAFMYKCLPQSIQASISKEFNNVDKRELNQYLQVLTKFRNVCAHNERLFLYRTRDAIPDTSLHIKFNIPKKGSQYVQGKDDLFSVVIALRYLQGKEEFCKFKRQLGGIIYQFISKTSQITVLELTSKMGFPHDWKKITTFKI